MATTKKQTVLVKVFRKLNPSNRWFNQMDRLEDVLEVYAMGADPRFGGDGEEWTAEVPHPDAVEAICRVYDPRTYDLVYRWPAWCGPRIERIISTKTA